MKITDHRDARDCLNKSVVEICKKKVFTSSRYHILMLSLPINQPLASDILATTRVSIGF